MNLYAMQLREWLAQRHKFESKVNVSHDNAILRLRLN